MPVISDHAKMLPTDRPLIYLADLLRHVEYPFQEKNPCTQSLLIDPKTDSHQGAIEPSHVLTAIGLSREGASSTIRISLGRFLKENELDIVSTDLQASFKSLAATQ